MLLTSYERAKRFLCINDDDVKSRRALVTYISAVSANIEAYLDREFEKKSRTEYFNLRKGGREFWVKAPEIESLTSVEVDPTGEFTGSQTPLSNSFVGVTNSSIVLQYEQIPSKRGLKVEYIGGVATTTSLSTYILTAIVGAFPVGSFLEGQRSGATGIVKSINYSSGETLVDVLYGVFQEGETLGMRPQEDDGLASGISATLSEVTNKSFVELFPEIATACDIQLGYNLRTKDDFENTSVEKDKVNRRDMPLPKYQYNDIQPEVRTLLNKYVRVVFY